MARKLTKIFAPKNAKERGNEQCRTLNPVSLLAVVDGCFPQLSTAMYLDPSLNPKCKECNTVDIDFTFKKIFGCLVCNKCKDQYPEKYSLLTKTECKEVCLSSQLMLASSHAPDVGLPSH